MVYVVQLLSISFAIIPQRLPLGISIFFLFGIVGSGPWEKQFSNRLKTCSLSFSLQEKTKNTSYCWWLKSSTTWDVWNPINNGKNYQPQLLQDFRTINSTTPLNIPEHLPTNQNSLPLTRLLSSACDARPRGTDQETHGVFQRTTTTVKWRAQQLRG